MCHVFGEETLGAVKPVSIWKRWYTNLRFFHPVQEAEHFTTTSASPDEYAFSAWIPWKWERIKALHIKISNSNLAEYVLFRSIPPPTYLCFACFCLSLFVNICCALLYTTGKSLGVPTFESKQKQKSQPKG